MDNKKDQIEVIKFIKSTKYQEVLSGYAERISTIQDQFNGLYVWDDYRSGDAVFSENYMYWVDIKGYLAKIEDIEKTGTESKGAELIIEMFKTQINHIKSHTYNVTNSFGMSKDVAVFTSDDVLKRDIRNLSNIHLFIIGLMNPTQPHEEWLSDIQRLEIYDNPEDIED